MKINTKLLAGLIMGALVYQLVYAQISNTHELEPKGIEMAHQLNQLAAQNKANLCSGDTLSAAAYLELAAFTSLAYGESKLKEISNGRAYWTHLAIQVRPYIEKASFIKKQLERSSSSETDEVAYL